MDKKIYNPNEMPNQRIRDNRKQTKEFTVSCTNYIIDRALEEDDKQDTIKHLKHANGEIDDDTIKYAVAPYAKYTQDVEKQIKFPNTIREIDIISGIKERYIGEFIKQYSNYQVYIHDSDSIFARNKELKATLISKMLNKFQELVNTQDESKVKELDLDKFSREFIEEWKDERIIKAQHRLNLINDLTEADIKYIQAFFYWLATEEVYTYRKVYNNELIKEIVAPWEYHRIDSGNMFVEDDDAGMRHYKLSLSQIEDYYRDVLSDEDRDYLTQIVKYSSESDDIVLPQSLLYSRYDNKHSEFQAVAKDTHSFYDKSRMVDVYHCVWKTETLIYNLKYYDFITGEVKTIQVPQTYKFSPENGDISITEEWINEVMESTRFGGKWEGIYLPAKKVEVQRQEINNSSICKLPYNGIKGMLKGNRIKPICTRLIVYQTLLKLYHLQREKAIAKFKTWTIIPEDFINDSNEMTTTERLTYAALDDLLPVNLSDIEPAAFQAIKSLYNAGAERYIGILTEVINGLRQEALDVANMNEQRYGDIQGNSGKSVTEYAITKATTGSILFFEMFNKFRERDLAADLDYSKAAWIDGKKGSYIDPATNEVVYVDIDGVEELSTNIGVFIRNSALEEEKLKAYRDIAFAASQNGDASLAADAIASENSTEIRRLIKKAEDARKEYDAMMQNMTVQAQEAASQGALKLEQQKHSNAIELELIKQDNENRRQAAELEIQLIDIQTRANQIPLNNDMPDDYKAKLEQVNQQLAIQKAALDELKIRNQIKQQSKKTV
ncbi:hypothetical protein DSECCO2_120210 [anaerobic digester metagenome]